MNVMMILIMAFICEAIWQTLKMTFQREKYATLDRIGALAVGIIVSVSCNLDILNLIKIDSQIPYLGVILTGILISRGSNFIHDFIQIINDVQQSNK